MTTNEEKKRDLMEPALTELGYSGYQIYKSMRDKPELIKESPAEQSLASVLSSLRIGFHSTCTAEDYFENHFSLLLEDGGYSLKKYQALKRAKKALGKYVIFLFGTLLTVFLTTMLVVPPLKNEVYPVVFTIFIFAIGAVHYLVSESVTHRLDQLDYRYGVNKRDLEAVHDEKANPELIEKALRIKEKDSSVKFVRCWFNDANGNPFEGNQSFLVSNSSGEEWYIFPDGFFTDAFLE